MRSEEDDGGTWAVPGEESHEHPDVLSPDEKDEDEREPPLPGPAEPKQPAPRRD